MLRISLLDVLLRGMPESFLFFYAGYMFSHKKFDIICITISTIIMALSVYFIRRLPIQFGVHVILNMAVYLVLLWNINSISYRKSIEYCVVLMFMLSTSELINIGIIDIIWQDEFKVIWNNDLLKNVYFIPSLILFMLGILLYYKLFCNHKHKRGGNFNVFGRTCVK